MECYYILLRQEGARFLSQAIHFVSCHDHGLVFAASSDLFIQILTNPTIDQNTPAVRQSAETLCVCHTPDPTRHTQRISMAANTYRRAYDQAGAPSPLRKLRAALALLRSFS